MKPIQRDSSQQGQSLIILAAGMVVFLALVSIVVDAGMDYVQRRQVFNSMDAAAQAGTLKVAVDGSTNADVMTAVTNYAQTNGTDPANVTAYYVGRDAAGHFATSTAAITPDSSAVPPTFTQSGTVYTVVGVSVQGNRTFNTFFAGLLGFRQLPVSGFSKAYTSRGGVCVQNGVFPMALSMATFPTVNGVPVVHTEQADPTWTYNVYEKAQAGPGNFGWLTWNGSTSASTLDSNLQNTGNSGTIHVGDNLQGSTGAMNGSNIRADIQYYIDHNTPVIIPIYDTVQGSGANLTYRVIGFARFHLTGMDTTGNPKMIVGKFQSWVSESSSSWCTTFGVTGVTIKPPPSQASQRILIGSVKLQNFSISNPTVITTHIPVDVINLLDISGSMTANFGSTSKIQAAKNALTSFNSNMQPALGDQVGLVVFPLNNGSGATSGANYQMACGGNFSSYYYGQSLSTLTGNYTATNSIINGLNANGGTPTASGLSIARQTVLGAGHVITHPAVIILASDGIANIRLNGQWTGFQGNTYEALDCNQPAETDAITEANLAKSDLNNDGKADMIIYSIAVGTDFNPALLQAIATVDTDPSRPHYFTASDANSMASIYAQIAGQVQDMQGECNVTPTEAFAAGATISVRAPSGAVTNVTTNSAGQFLIPNAEVGTYQITGATVTSNGLTYNIATEGVGGAVIDWPINVTVGQNQEQYATSFALKPTTNVTCTH